MHVVIYILAGSVFAYWLYGISQPYYNRPKILWKPSGIYGVLFVAISLVLIGYFLSL